MKKNIETIAVRSGCGIAACLECALCEATHFEEQRRLKPVTKNESVQLYHAEALSYEFYFSPDHLRAKIS